jgi:hypothetical protein
MQRPQAGERRERAKVFSNWGRTDEERKMSLALQEVATEVGVEGITAGVQLFFSLSA